MATTNRFNRFLEKHHNYKKERQIEEGKTSIIDYSSYLSQTVPKFSISFKDDEYIKQIAKLDVSPVIEGNQATFIYKGRARYKVDLISELTYWSSNRNTILKKVNGENIYHITLDFPQDARIEYKLTVDHEWILDPMNPLQCRNGIGGINSYLIMGKYKKVSEINKKDNIPHGNIEKFEFDGESIKGKRMISVYLPYGYDKNLNERYPVMYMHDGEDYINNSHAINTLDNLIAEKKIRPIIGVFINPIDRLREYMYNQKYSKLIAEEIIPKIDNNYRTIPQAEARGIMGASLGGIISFFTAYIFPSVFKNVAGQSSSFLYLEKEITRCIENSNAKFNVYFDVGRFESLIHPNRRVLDIYKKKNIDYFYQEINEGHTWSNWGTHFKDALTFFWGNHNDNKTEKRIVVLPEN